MTICSLHYRKKAKADCVKDNPNDQIILSNYCSSITESGNKNVGFSTTVTKILKCFFAHYLSLRAYVRETIKMCSVLTKQQPKKIIFRTEAHLCYKAQCQFSTAYLLKRLNQEQLTEDMSFMLPGNSKRIDLFPIHESL